MLFRSSWQSYIAEKGAPPLLSEYAVKVYGSGHVVAYNRVSGFHDGIDMATYGNPDGSPNPIRERLPVSVDFYGNDISNVDDNCLEADGGAHNIRIFRNRCFNMAHRALSVQPAFGGPVYFVRNVVYHAPEGGALKLTSSSAGVVVYHNTFVAPVHPMLGAVSNQQYRNNLKEKLTIESNLNLVIKDISDVQEAVQKTFKLQDDFMNIGKGNRGSGLYRQVVFYLLKHGKRMSSRNIAARLRFDPKSINVGLKYFENTMKINTELKDAEIGRAHV